MKPLLASTLAVALAATLAAVPTLAQTPQTNPQPGATTGAPSTGAQRPTPPPPGTPAAVPGVAPDPDLGPTGPSRATGRVVEEPPAVEPAAQPERLNAAVAAFVEGLWELDAVSELPRASQELVFARLTFADDRLTTTTVYLDPDDGRLYGLSRRDRYLVADGQVLVREDQRVRLLDIEPTTDDDSRMTVRDIQDGIEMRLRRVDASVVHDPGLYGTWSVAPPDHREAITITFTPDGRAVGTSGGDAFDVEYVVAGAYVITDNRDTFRYTLSGTHLVMERGDELILLSRAVR